MFAEQPVRPLASDLILLLLAAPTEVRDAKDQLRGITRLEKLLFLVDREGGIADLVRDPFHFRPYNFGPYSKGVYEAVELLEELGLVREERSIEDASLDEMEEIAAALDEQEGVERRFILTPKGKAVAELLSQRHPDISGRLKEIKDRYVGLSLRHLIRDVYTRYPDMASESLIKDSI